MDGILAGRSVVDGKEINAAVTSFVDDVSKTTPVRTHKVRDVEECAKRAHEALVSECRRVEVKVHSEKEVTQPWVSGEGAREAMREWYDREDRRGFKAQKAMRYLGPRLTIECTATVEGRIRIKEAGRAFYSMRHIWRSSIAWKIKVIIFKGVYVSTLLTGMTAFAMRASDYRALEKDVCKKARSILREWGVVKEEELYRTRRY